MSCIQKLLMQAWRLAYVEIASRKTGPHRSFAFGCCRNVVLRYAGVLEEIILHTGFHAPRALLFLAPGSGVAACRFRSVDWPFLCSDFSDAGLPGPQGAPGHSLPLDDPWLRFVYCRLRRHPF